MAVKIKLSDKDFDNLLEYLNDIQDAGPMTYGWQSEKLVNLISEIESQRKV